MRKIIKIITAVIGTLVVLFIIALIVLTHVVNPNDYKQRLDHYIFQRTGRHLAIGKIGWSFIPWIGVDLKKVRLTNPTNFTGTNLANIGEIKVKVRFWPLFIGSVQLGTVVIHQAHINLIISAQGKNNWSDWNGVSTTKPPATAQAHQSQSARRVPIHAIEIAGVRIKDSTIDLINRQTRNRTRLTHFNFTSGAINNARNFPIKLKFILQAINNKNKTLISARSTANLNLKHQLYRLTNLTITATIRRPKLPPLIATLTGNTTVNLARQDLLFVPLTVQIANLRINGRLNINKLLQTPYITATLAARSTQIKPLVTALYGHGLLQGQLSFDSAITTYGTSQQTFIKNLNGKGKFLIKNGIISGIDLPYILSVARALIRKEPPPAHQGPPQTSFSSLAASYVIRRGILTNNDLNLIINKRIGANGNGAINLNNARVNYVLTTQYRDRPNTQPGLTIPINIQGTTGNLSFKPDYSSIAKQAVTTTIKHKIKHYIDGGDNKIKNFFNRL